jgi:hypothetical protein
MLVNGLSTACVLKQYPTKALAPLMLEDYRKVMVDHRGEEEQYSYQDIQRCVKKGNLRRFQHFFRSQQKYAWMIILICSSYLTFQSYLWT